MSNKDMVYSIYLKQTVNYCFSSHTKLLYVHFDQFIMS